MKRLIIIALLIWSVMQVDAYAKGLRATVREGNEFYKQGDFDASIESYQKAITSDQEDSIANLNLGTAYYKKGDYPMAAVHLQKGLLSDDVDVKRNAHYNLGNTFYQAGVGLEDSNVTVAIEKLKSALKQYEGALAIDPEDEDTKFNYEFVKKELERLKQQQKQQQQQQQSSSNSNEDNEQDQQQESSSSQKDESQSEENKSQDQSSSDESQEQESKEKEEEASSDDQSSEEENSSEEQDEEQKSKDESQPSDQQDAPFQSTQNQEYNADEFTPQEAELLLENYQRTEEPQGMLNIMSNTQDERPVRKDW